MVKQLFSVKLFPVIGLLLLWSCQKNLTAEQERKVFRYNEHANITSLDPAFAKDQRNIWAANQLYNGLVQLDDSLTIQPDLAEKWEVSDDGLTYLFHLRPDVFFHKNKVFGKDSLRKVGAKDVVYSLERLRDNDLASPGSWVLRDVQSIKALNPHEVEIILQEKFPAFLGLLSMTYCSIIPQEMEQLDFHQSPIGTGPFQFKRWEPNEKLVFRRNPLYFEKDKNGNHLPYLEAVAISFLPEKQSEFMQFTLGNLDFMSGLDAAYKDELVTSTGELQATYQDRIKLRKAPYLNVEYIGLNLNQHDKEMHSQELRKALNFGFDRQRMIDYLRNGIGEPAIYGFIPKALPGFSGETNYTYQPQKAKQFIQEYRQNNSNRKPHITIATTAQYLDLCEYLQREWQKIGVSVEVDVMPPSTLLQQRAAGKLQSFRASWIADYPDAENYLSLFYSKNFSPNGPNYTHFKSEEFDQLYERSLRLPNLEDRTPLYEQMDSIVMSQAPVIPLYYDEVVRFIGKNVKGLGINSQNLLDLRHVTKTE